MNEYSIVKIKDNPELKNRAASWFHEKWRVPLEIDWRSPHLPLTAMYYMDKCK